MSVKSKKNQDSLGKIFESMGRGRRKKDKFNISGLNNKQIKALSSLMAIGEKKRVRKAYQRLLKALRDSQLGEDRAIIKAYHQNLSDLPNKEFFEDVLNALTKRAADGHGFATLMIDINKFKNFNDTYGHDKGDDVIRLIAEKLKSVSRKDTDFVSHWGGDEFVMIIGDVSEKGTKAVYDKIKSIFPVCIEAGDKEIPVNVSIGYVSTNSIDEVWEALPDNDNKPKADKIKNLRYVLSGKKSSKADIQEAANTIFKLSDANMYMVKHSGSVAVEKRTSKAVTNQPR